MNHLSDLQPLHEVPKNVLEAANLIDLHFKNIGIDRWELMNVCSRNFALDLWKVRGIVKTQLAPALNSK